MGMTGCGTNFRTNAPGGRKAISCRLKGLLLFLTLSAALVTKSQAITLISANSTAVWSADNLTTEMAAFALESNPGHIFENDPSFFLILELDDRTIQVDRPYGTIVVDTGYPFGLGHTYFRSGTVINEENYHGSQAANYLGADEFKNEAQAGTNNYLAFVLNDRDGQPHYGWLQFELQSLQNGEIGINFLAGAINPIANQAITAGVVPEPTTIGAIIAGGISLLILTRNRRTDA